MSYEDNIPEEEITWQTEAVRMGVLLVAFLILIAILLGIHWGIA